METNTPSKANATVTPNTRTSRRFYDFEAMEWARSFPRGTLTRTERSVLRELVCYSDPRDRAKGCWPSLKLLAEMTDLSKPTVLKAVRGLESKGIIHITKQRNKTGQQGPHLYNLLIDEKHAEKRDSRVKPFNSGEGVPESNSFTLEHKTRVKLTPKPESNSDQNQSKNQGCIERIEEKDKIEREREAAATASSSPANVLSLSKKPTARPEESSFGKVVAHWQKIFDLADTQPTENERRVLAERLRDSSETDILNAISGAKGVEWYRKEPGRESLKVILRSREEVEKLAASFRRSKKPSQSTNSASGGSQRFCDACRQELGWLRHESGDLLGRCDHEGRETYSLDVFGEIIRGSIEPMRAA